MAYQALYRVWRSQTFEDVVGQQHITRTLQNAIEQNKISHAYLFSGPRGTGKTSAARIMAKTINCKNSENKEPCNKCHNCLSITDGSSTDIIEIDAASNNGVDEIRELRDKVKYAPVNTRFKVYIIDEVHMLSTGAFNALLKTLEEPPEHVIFILATTEPHKIPLTIHSRCQRYDFKQIEVSDIVGRLETVLNGTGVDFDADALPIIARAARGGMRDALSLLDQAISFSFEKVTVEDALAVTGSVSQDTMAKITNEIFENNTAEALNLLDSLLSTGKDASRFVEEMIYYYRDILLTQVTGEAGDELLKELAGKMPAQVLYRYIEEWNKATQEMKWSTNQRVFLEVTIVKLCQPVVEQVASEVAPVQTQPVIDLKPLYDKITKLEAEVARFSRQAIGQPAVQTFVAPKVETVPQVNFEKIPVNIKPTLEEVGVVLSNATKGDKDLLAMKWNEICLGLQNFSTILLESEPVAVSPTSFVLKFKHNVQIQELKNEDTFISQLKNAVMSVTGRNFDVICVFEQDWLELRQEFINRRKNGGNPLVQQSQQDQVVLKATELFGTEFVEVIE